MCTMRRRDALLLLVVLPDGSRSLIPASWSDWQSAPMIQSNLIGADREPCLAPVADLLAHGPRDALLGRCLIPQQRQRPTRRVAMQLTLAFLEAPPQQPTLSDQLDAEARIEAVKILARIIAQAVVTAERMEATDE